MIAAIVLKLNNIFACSAKIFIEQLFFKHMVCLAALESYFKAHIAIRAAKFYNGGVRICL
jgi:hypothetical protein